MWLLHFARVVAWIPMRIAYPTKVIGTAKLPKGKVIIACNHTSLVDPLILTTRTSRPVCFMAKKEIFQNSFNRWLFKNLHCIPVERKGTDFAAMKSVLKALKEGYAFGLFPEGTRAIDDTKLLEIKNGVCLFALKSKASVIPMVFLRKPKLFRMNYLMIEKPIDFAEFQDQRFSSELVESATKVLEAKMISMKEELIKMKAPKNKGKTK